MEVDPEKLTAVTKVKPPANLKKVRTNLGLLLDEFYCSFGAVSKQITPLDRMLNKSENFVGTSELLIHLS